MTLPTFLALLFLVAMFWGSSGVATVTFILVSVYVIYELGWGGGDTKT